MTYNFTTMTLTQDELADVASLCDATRPEVFQILAACPIRALDAGEVLLQAGQANDRMHFVLSGSLGIRLRSATSDRITTIVLGGTVGELSVVDQMPATAFVVAEEPTRVLTIDTDTFWHLITVAPAFARDVIGSLTAQVRRSTVSLVQSLDANSELEARATIDQLTNVYNRRWLTDWAERFLARVTRAGATETLSICMVDVDHFKKFNDAYGHPAGDAVLVTVAKTMVASIRPGDYVARYGGEEFVLVLPNTKLEHARIVADRVRNAVSKCEAIGTDGNALPPVTISIGVAQAVNETKLTPLVERADALLYQAKKNGRDRVES